MPGNWLPASLGYPLPWWPPPDRRSLSKEVLFSLAQLTGFPFLVPGKRSFVCDAQSHWGSGLIKSPLPGSYVQFLSFSEPVQMRNWLVMWREHRGGICPFSHPLLHTVLDGSPKIVVKKWWLCCAKTTDKGFNLSEYSLHFLVLQFRGGFPKWAVAEGSTKINCLSSGYKV